MRKTDLTKQSEFIKKYDMGTSIQALQMEFHITKSTAYRWIRQHSELRKRVTCNETRGLVEKIDRQEKALEIYRRTGLGMESPIDERIAAISKLLGEYSLNLLTDTLGVSKATFYRATRDKHETSYDIKRREMLPIIQSIFNDSKQTLGAAKITAILRDRGYRITEKLVADIMHKNEMFSMRSGAKKIYLQNRERMQNILQQQFDVSHPNEVWVSDVTEYELKGYKYYICVMLDLFARKIVAHHISTKNSTQLTTRTFKKASESRHLDSSLLIHTDRGANFTSKNYNKLLHELQVRHSYSASGHPYDNSVCEAFFKTLKQEELYRHEYHSEAEMKRGVSDYIERYNSKRPHAYLHNRTPNAIEQAYWEKHA